MDQQHCDQCENHCSIDALQCGKGRRHFGLESDENGGKHAMGRELPRGPVGLLLQCGHFLHHGGVNGEDLLSALTPREQDELERLLGLLLSDWKARMSSDSPESSHHRHAK